ncbi:uncharacterized protein [Argopecten irradians]|uniref:uncharacterized protein n=1 Tax=Argopecten irradians TaxID=31199 RepID=UPI00371C0BE4
MSNVKVAVRVRPLSEKEREKNAKFIVDVNGDTISVENIKVESQSEFGDSREKVKTFTFDYCYDSTVDPTSPAFASQELVFQDLGTEVLQAAFEGYNACLFAYGQTSTGKTHTMMGRQEDAGLIPRICEGLFSHVDNFVDQDNLSFHVKISYLEIYNERVRDLLRPSLLKKNEKYTLKVREHPKEGPYIQDLSTHFINDNQQIQAILERGNEYRTTASTYMHDHSSRSHAIVTIEFTQAKIEDDLPHEIVSKLHLVDLAGSERADPNYWSGYKGRLREGSNINKSLVTLGNVIKALAERSLLSCSSDNLGASVASIQSSPGGDSAKKRLPYIPYRDSVLTWLLKDSLGGNSKTIMISTITPASMYYNETLSTLRYAQRAKSIINKPKVNEDPNVSLIRDLRREIERLREMLASTRMANSRSSLNEIVFLMPPNFQKMHDIDMDSEQGDSFLQLPDSNSVLAEKLQENENMVDKLTQTWIDKWREAHEAIRDSDLSIRGLKGKSNSMGVLIESQLPHLVGMDDDILSTGVTIYYLKDGKTLLGREDADREQDIVLSGPSVQREHCFIKNTLGNVILHPNRRANCAINGIDCRGPTRLKQGKVIYQYNIDLSLVGAKIPLGSLVSSPDLNGRHQLEKDFDSDPKRIEEAKRELQRVRDEHRKAEEERQLREEQLWRLHESHRQEIEQQRHSLNEIVEENLAQHQRAEEELAYARDCLLQEKEAFQQYLKEELAKVKKGQAKSEFGSQTELSKVQTADVGCEQELEDIERKKESLQGQMKALAQGELIRHLSYRDTEQRLIEEAEEIEDQYHTTQDQLDAELQQLEEVEKSYRSVDRSQLQDITRTDDDLTDLDRQQEQLHQYIAEKQGLMQVRLDVPRALRSACSEEVLTDVQTSSLGFPFRASSLLALKQGSDGDLPSMSARLSLKSSLNITSLDSIPDSVDSMDTSPSTSFSNHGVTTRKRSTRSPASDTLTSEAKEVTNRLYKAHPPKFKYEPKQKPKVVPVNKRELQKDTNISGRKDISDTKSKRGTDNGKGKSKSPSPGRQTVPGRQTTPSPGRQTTPSPGRQTTRRQTTPSPGRQTTPSPGRQTTLSAGKRTSPSPGKPASTTQRRKQVSQKPELAIEGDDKDKSSRSMGQPPGGTKRTRRSSDKSGVVPHLRQSLSQPILNRGLSNNPRLTPTKLRPINSATSLASVPEAVGEETEAIDQVSSSVVVRRRRKRQFNEDDTRRHSEPVGESLADAYDKYTQEMEANIEIPVILLHKDLPGEQGKELGGDLDGEHNTYQSFTCEEERRNVVTDTPDQAVTLELSTIQDQSMAWHSVGQDCVNNVDNIPTEHQCNVNLLTNEQEASPQNKGDDSVFRNDLEYQQETVARSVELDSDSGFYPESSDNFESSGAHSFAGSINNCLGRSGLDPGIQSSPGVDPGTQSGLGLDPGTQSGPGLYPGTQSRDTVWSWFRSRDTVWSWWIQSGLWCVEPGIQSGPGLDPGIQSGPGVEPGIQSGPSVEPGVYVECEERTEISYPQQMNSQIISQNLNPQLSFNPSFRTSSGFVVCNTLQDAAKMMSTDGAHTAYSSDSLEDADSLDGSKPQTSREHEDLTDSLEDSDNDEGLDKSKYKKIKVGIASLQDVGELTGPQNDTASLQDVGELTGPQNDTASLQDVGELTGPQNDTASLQDVGELTGPQNDTASLQDDGELTGPQNDTASLQDVGELTGPQNDTASLQDDGELTGPQNDTASLQDVGELTGPQNDTASLQDDGELTGPQNDTASLQDVGELIGPQNDTASLHDVGELTGPQNDTASLYDVGELTGRQNDTASLQDDGELTGPQNDTASLQDDGELTGPQNDTASLQDDGELTGPQNDTASLQDDGELTGPQNDTASLHDVGEHTGQQHDTAFLQLKAAETKDCEQKYYQTENNKIVQLDTNSCLKNDKVIESSTCVTSKSRKDSDNETVLRIDTDIEVSNVEKKSNLSQTSVEIFSTPVPDNPAGDRKVTLTKSDVNICSTHNTGDLYEPSVVVCPGELDTSEPSVVVCPGELDTSEPSVVVCPGELDTSEPSVVVCPGELDTSEPSVVVCPGELDTSEPSVVVCPGELDTSEPSVVVCPGELDTSEPSVVVCPGELDTSEPSVVVCPGELDTSEPSVVVCPGELDTSEPSVVVCPGELDTSEPSVVVCPGELDTSEPSVVVCPGELDTSEPSVVVCPGELDTSEPSVVVCPGELDTSEPSVVVCPGELDTSEPSVVVCPGELDTSEPSVVVCPGELDTSEPFVVVCPGELDISEPSVVVCPGELDTSEPSVVVCPGELDTSEPSVVVCPGELDTSEPSVVVCPGELDTSEPSVVVCPGELDTSEPSVVVCPGELDTSEPSVVVCPGVVEPSEPWESNSDSNYGQVISIKEITPIPSHYDTKNQEVLVDSSASAIAGNNTEDCSSQTNKDMVPISPVSEVTGQTSSMVTTPDLMAETQDVGEGSDCSQDSIQELQEQLQQLEEFPGQRSAGSNGNPSLSSSRKATRHRAMIRQKHRGVEESDDLSPESGDSFGSGNLSKPSSRPDSASKRRRRIIKSKSDRRSNLKAPSSEDYVNTESDDVCSDDSHPHKGEINNDVKQDSFDQSDYSVTYSDFAQQLSLALDGHDSHYTCKCAENSEELGDQAVDIKPEEFNMEGHYINGFTNNDEEKSKGAIPKKKNKHFRKRTSYGSSTSDLENDIRPSSRTPSETRDMEQQTDVSWLEVPEMSTSRQRSPVLNISPMSVWNSGDRGIKASNGPHGSGGVNVTMDSRHIKKSKRTKPVKLECSQPDVWSAGTWVEDYASSGKLDAEFSSDSEDDHAYVMETEVFSPQSPSACDKFFDDGDSADTKEDSVKYYVTINEENTNISYNIDRTEYKTYSLRSQIQPNEQMMSIPESININLTSTNSHTSESRHASSSSQRIHLNNQTSLPDHNVLVSERTFRCVHEAARDEEDVMERHFEEESTSSYLEFCQGTSTPHPTHVSVETGDINKNDVLSPRESDTTSDYGTMIMDNRRDYTSFTLDSGDEEMSQASGYKSHPDNQDASPLEDKVFDIPNDDLLLAETRNVPTVMTEDVDSISHNGQQLCPSKQITKRNIVAGTQQLPCEPELISNVISSEQVDHLSDESSDVEINHFVKAETVPHSENVAEQVLDAFARMSSLTGANMEDSDVLSVSLDRLQGPESVSSDSSIYKTPQQSPRDYEEGNTGALENIVIPDHPQSPRLSDGHRGEPLNLISTSPPKAEQRTVSVTTDPLAGPFVRRRTVDESSVREDLKRELQQKLARLQKHVRSRSDSAISSDYTDGDSTSVSPRGSRLYESDKTLRGGPFLDQADRRYPEDIRVMVTQTRTPFDPSAAGQSFSSTVNRLLDIDNKKPKKSPLKDSGNVFDDSDIGDQVEDAIVPVKAEKKEFSNFVLADNEDSNCDNDITQSVISDSRSLSPGELVLSPSSSGDIFESVGSGSSDLEEVYRINASGIEANDEDDGVVPRSLPGTQRSVRKEKSPSMSDIADLRCDRDLKRSMSEANVDDFEEISSSDGSNDSIVFVFMGQSHTSESMEKLQNEYNPLPFGNDSEPVYKPLESSQLQFEDMPPRNEEQIPELRIKDKMILESKEILKPSRSPDHTGECGYNNYDEEDNEPLRHKFGIDETVLPIPVRSVSSDNIPKQTVSNLIVHRSRSTDLLETNTSENPNDPINNEGIFPPNVSSDFWDNEHEYQGNIVVIEEYYSDDNDSKKTTSDVNLDRSEDRFIDEEHMTETTEEITYSELIPSQAHKHRIIPSSDVNYSGNIDNSDELDREGQNVAESSTFAAPGPVDKSDRQGLTLNFTASGNRQPDSGTHRCLTEAGTQTEDFSKNQESQVLPALASPYRAQSTGNINPVDSSIILTLPESTENWENLSHMVIESTALINNINQDIQGVHTNPRSSGEVQSTSPLTSRPKPVNKQNNPDIVAHDDATQTTGSLTDLHNLAIQTDEEWISFDREDSPSSNDSTQTDTDITRPRELSETETTDIIPLTVELPVDYDRVFPPETSKEMYCQTSPDTTVDTVDSSMQTDEFEKVLSRLSHALKNEGSEPEGIEEEIRVSSIGSVNAQKTLKLSSGHITSCVEDQAAIESKTAEHHLRKYNTKQDQTQTVIIERQSVIETETNVPDMDVTNAEMEALKAEHIKMMDSLKKAAEGRKIRTQELKTRLEKQTNLENQPGKTPEPKSGKSSKETLHGPPTEAIEELILPVKETDQQSSVPSIASEIDSHRSTQVSRLDSLSSLTSEGTLLGEEVSYFLSDECDGRLYTYKEGFRSGAENKTLLARNNMTNEPVEDKLSDREGSPQLQTPPNSPTALRNDETKHSQYQNTQPYRRSPEVQPNYLALLKTKTPVTYVRETSGKISTGVEVSVDSSDDFTQTDLQALKLDLEEFNIDSTTHSETRTVRSKSNPSIKSELSRLQKERVEIIELLSMNYLPASLTVELLEAKLNYCIGQTDTLLKTLEETWDRTDIIITDEHHHTDITREYVTNYRHDLQKSKWDIQVCKEKMNRGLKHGAGRGRTRTRNRDIAKWKRLEEIEAFKAERFMEQQNYERARSISPLKKVSPCENERHSRSASPSSLETSPRLMTPKQHRDHLVDLRRTLVEVIERDENAYRASRSCSPQLSHYDDTDRMFSPRSSSYNCSPQTSPIHVRHSPHASQEHHYMPRIPISPRASPERHYSPSSSPEHQRYRTYYDSTNSLVVPDQYTLTSSPRSYSYSPARTHAQIRSDLYNGTSLSSRVTSTSPQRTQSTPRKTHFDYDGVQDRESRSNDQSNAFQDTRDLFRDMQEARMQNQQEIARAQNTLLHSARNYSGMRSRTSSNASSRRSYSCYRDYARDLIEGGQRSIHGVVSGSYELYDDSTPHVRAVVSPPSSIVSDLESLPDSVLSEQYAGRIINTDPLRTRPINSTDIKSRIRKQRRIPTT